MRLIIEEEHSKIVIEPRGKVLDTLRLAVLDVGLNKFLAQTNTTPEMLEKWINGENWIPVDILKEACNINSKNPNVPSYSKVLSECTTGASFKIIAEEAEKETAKAPPIHPIAQRVPEGKITEQEAIQQMIKMEIVLSLALILPIIIGFFIGSFMGAVSGAILGFIIVCMFTFLFLGKRK